MAAWARTADHEANNGSVRGYLTAKILASAKCRQATSSRAAVAVRRRPQNTVLLASGSPGERDGRLAATRTEKAERHNFCPGPDRHGHRRYVWRESNWQDHISETLGRRLASLLELADGHSRGSGTVPGVPEFKHKEQRRTVRLGVDVQGIIHPDGEYAP